MTQPPEFPPDLVAPRAIVRALAEDAAGKAGFTWRQTLVRSFLCTPFLAYAVALVAMLISQGVPSGAAGLLFPVGYVMLAILGLEMATGSFSVMPIGLRVGPVTWRDVLRNWFWTYGGNVAGGAFFAWLLWFSLTRGGARPPEGLLLVILEQAGKKIAYQDYGARGWLAAVGMGVLCNWLVSLGPIIGKASRSVAGKVLLIWLPISTFYAIGFEHAIVNLFVFPLGILAGADIGLSEWWLWNQIPVTLGNIIGAVLFNSVLWAGTHLGPGGNR